MSKMNVFNPGWIDIVFEGRNQEYGAYRLRRDDSKTTITALFAGILLLGVIVAVPFVISNLFRTTTAMVKPATDDAVLVVTDLVTPPEIKQPEPEGPAAPAQKSTVAQTELKALNPVPATQVTKEPPVKDDFTTSNPSDHTQAATPGNNIAIGSNGATEGTEEGTGKTPAVTESNAVATTLELDAQPQFPGGIDKFRAYVGNNFNPSTGAGDNTSVKMFVNFIIEKDGTLSNIRTRSTDEALSREAVRVLKSLKAKWIPGKKNGLYVRTAYSLPITVNLRN